MKTYNNGDFFNSSKLEINIIFLIGYMYLFDSVLKVYFKTGIIDIYKIDFDEEYKYIYFNILDILNQYVELSKIKKDFLSEFQDLDTLLKSGEDIENIIGDTDLFWNNGGYLKLFNDVKNLQYKLKIKYNVSYICSIYGNKILLNKNDNPDLSDEVILNTNELIGRSIMFTEIQTKIYPKIIAYGNYIHQEYNKLLGIKGEKVNIVGLDKIGLRLNENTGDVTIDGELLGKIKLNTQEYDFFKFLYNNKGIFFTHDEIFKKMYKDKSMEKMPSSFYSDLKRRLPPLVKKIIISEKGGYLIK